MNLQRIYDSLVRRAAERGVVGGYVEHHHVIPRAHGGSNAPDNLVQLTAREHYIAHWLLWRIHRDRVTARAFRLLTDVTGRPRSRSYAEAKAVYARSMVGERNVAKRPEVRAKISAALRENHPYTGIERPGHAKLLRERGNWRGPQNPWYGTGHRQCGSANHMARAVTGVHATNGSVTWETSYAAATSIGVTPQAICQAIKRGGASRGWKLEYVV